MKAPYTGGPTFGNTPRIKKAPGARVGFASSVDKKDMFAKRSKATGPPKARALQPLVSEPLFEDPEAKWQQFLSQMVDEGLIVRNFAIVRDDDTCVPGFVAVARKAYSIPTAPNASGTVET